jgi:hypothetical protein
VHGAEREALHQHSRPRKADGQGKPYHPEPKIGRGKVELSPFGTPCFGVECGVIADRIMYNIILILSIDIWRFIAFLLTFLKKYDKLIIVQIIF